MICETSSGCNFRSAILPIRWIIVRSTGSSFQAAKPLTDELRTQGRLTPDAGSALVTILATKPVPDPFLSAAVADLAQSDFLTTFVDLRELNVTSRHEASSSAAFALQKTSQIAWLMLSLRSPDDKSGINLTNMDLRFGGDFVGQGMNLSNVDFSGAALAGGVWRGSDLTGATFDAVTTAAPLLCRSCVSGNVRATLQLVEGRWVSPSQ